MVRMRCAWMGVWLGLAWMPSAGVLAQDRVPPAAECLDARAMTEMHQPDARTMAVLAGDGRRFRLQLGADCPASEDAATLLAAEGWVCPGRKAFVRTSAATCAVTAVDVVDARAFAGLARVAGEHIRTLDTVQVRESRRRGFGGSPSYCFSLRHVRAWAETPRGLQVEVSPKSSGGNRFYHVELAHRCPGLDGSPAILFRSGMGIGMICGNPGDRVEALPESDARLPAIGARLHCNVSAVYPVDANGK